MSQRNALIPKRSVKMDTNQKLITMDMKAKLSISWIFVLLNVIFRDIHELFRPGLLAEMMTGTVNGVQMTEGTLLVAGIMLEIPIAMVLLSRVLPYRINRWANLIASVIGTFSINRGRQGAIVPHHNLRRPGIMDERYHLTRTAQCSMTLT